MIYDDLNLYTSKNVNFQRGVFAIHFMFAYMNPKITHVIVETAPQRHARCMGMGQNWVSFNVSESLFFWVKKNGNPKKGSDPFRVFCFPGQRQKEAETSGRVWTEDVGDAEEIRSREMVPWCFPFFTSWMSWMSWSPVIIQSSWMTMTSLRHVAARWLGVHDEMESPYRDGVFKHPNTCHGKSSIMVG